jgi:hypothetical protein
MDSASEHSALSLGSAVAPPQPNGVARALGLLALLVALGLAPLFVLRWRARALDARESFAHVFAAEQLPPGWSFGAAHALADGVRIVELKREPAIPLEPGTSTRPGLAEPVELDELAQANETSASKPSVDASAEPSGAELAAEPSADPLPIELLLVQCDDAQQLASWFPARPPPLGMGMGPGMGPGMGDGQAAPQSARAPSSSASQPASQPATEPSTQPASAATSQPASAPIEAVAKTPEPAKAGPPLRFTLATGDLEWGAWRAAYVLERWVPQSDPLRESLRVNLSHAGRYAMLRANWAPGAKAVPAELVRLLEQLELRAGPKAEQGAAGAASPP